MQLYMWVSTLWHLCNTLMRMGGEGCHSHFQVGNEGKDRLSDLAKATELAEEELASP